MASACTSPPSSRKKTTLSQLQAKMRKPGAISRRFLRQTAPSSGSECYFSSLDRTPSDLREETWFHSPTRSEDCTPAEWKMNWKEDNIDVCAYHQNQRTKEVRTSNRSTRRNTCTRGTSAVEVETWSEVTPRMLDEMVEEHGRVHAKHDDVPKEQSRLLLLPREIRDMIYACILVPDTPMEMAPFEDCQCNSGQWSEYWRRFDRSPNERERPRSDQFYKHMATKVYRPSLVFLRVCRQIYHEASAVYYGQPFRFSAKPGWDMLYFWLKQIGPRNRKLLKNITVCHPAMAEVGNLALHLQAFKISDSAPDVFHDYDWEWHSSLAGVSYDPRVGPPTRQRWAGWDSIPHTAFMLAELPRLLRLRFLVRRKDIHAQGDERDFYDFPTLTNHPVYEYLKEHSLCKNISIVKFIKYDDDENSLEATYNRSPQIDSEINRDARIFFHSVEQLGWKVEETRHDMWDHYPVAKGVQCGNEELCDYFYSIWEGPWFEVADCVRWEERLVDGEKPDNLIVFPWESNC